jgi:hypothetical protein
VRRQSNSDPVFTPEQIKRLRKAFEGRPTD